MPKQGIKITKVLKQLNPERWNIQVCIIYRNLWSLVSLAHFITHNILIFKKHSTSSHSADADGFGVCFEMGKKCYKMLALYIPSLWLNYEAIEYDPKEMEATWFCVTISRWSYLLIYFCGQHCKTFWRKY